MEGNGYVTAAAVQAAGQKDVETSLGKVLVGRLPYPLFVQIRGKLMDLQSLVREGGADRLEAPEFLESPEARKALEVVEPVLIAAVLQPKLQADPGVGPAPRSFSIEDQLVLFSAVMELTQFTRRAAEEVRP